MIPTSEVNPGKSTDRKILQAYFESLGFFTAEEIAALLPNWTRTVPQSMTEVEAGIVAERQRRDPNYYYFTPDNHS
ncbi:hypothetical protein A3A66_04140 [Microgenomates group bacterium RIFCSPLOWO2_01_FULL_46_13]|nr:MAG: hypothetical protein A2783_03615 [Microgenomates group bacterium RIFCSPHIGHO2_01_FULL_45_11]OGV94977.1 MAG: hypothetical protein A3A66_04140 [Microgenomates group bacterium RIFCSPLOWO2_01_FULL_46_13]